MKLPDLQFSDQIGTFGQARFGGLNHNLGAADGELWDMRNLTSDHYPLLASRAERMKLRTLTSPGGLFCWEKLCWVDGTDFLYDGAVKGQVTEGEKTFAALGAYIVILPDKAWYNVDTGEFGSLEASWTGESLTFTNGTLFGEEAECNTLRAEGVDWADFFRVGDAVTIEGCTVHPENNKTPIIREIDGDKLVFYEYVFALNGEAANEPYSETGALSVRRTVPDLKYICENENRLWGCDDRTIYASKLGDIFNWNVYDGLASDAWSVDTGSAGVFTGCCSYLGYPVFFKEFNIYKVYGSQPSNYEVMGSATLGVAAGSHKSLAVAGEVLFYLSRAGIIAYQGGVPQPAGAAFGHRRFRDAAAGSDGLKYYVSMEDEDGQRLLYVYDTQRGLWHIEDETDPVGFAFYDGALYWLGKDGGMWCADADLVREAPEGAEWEGPVDWWAETADFTEGGYAGAGYDRSANKKGVGPEFQVRLELDEAATAKLSIRMDSLGEWRQVDKPIEAEGTGQPKRSYVLAIIPQRADHYRLRLEGRGGCRVYSLARQLYSGSALRSQPGRH